MVIILLIMLDLPSYKMVIFHSYVSLPEDTDGLYTVNDG